MRTIGSKERHVFTATFVRFGFRNGYIDLTNDAFTRCDT